MGERLPRARRILADSRSDVCHLLGGIDTGTWNRWEKGGRYPDPVVTVRLCDLFDLTMDDLYRGKLAGGREDVAFRLAARHPEPVEDKPRG